MDIASEAVRVRPDSLRAFARRSLVKLGASKNNATLVGESLVGSNLVGVDSHGITRIFRYVDDVKVRSILPAARPKVDRLSRTAAVVDGQFGFGQVTARRAAEVACEMASHYGLGLVSMRQCNHIGRLGEFVEFAADNGFASLLFCNAGGRFPVLAPYGSRMPITGTNPVAFAVPVQGQHPLIVDFASSVWSEGAVRLAHDEGRSIPLGVVLDRFGVATTDPAALYSGGALTPFGGHKGSALSLIVEIVAGALTGVGFSGWSGYEGGCGGMFLTFRLDWLAPRERVEAIVSELCASIKGSDPACGFEEVLLPGERSRRERQRREQQGIPLSLSTWRGLAKLAREVGVRLPGAA